MGLVGTFGVQASGTNLKYQWSRDGSAITGATASSYTTGPTAFSDTGATFAVIVSNAAGSITSQAASLTITARAPKAGDLRFQQVDAASTIDGYSIGDAVIDTVQCPPPGGGGFATGNSAATGTGFFLTNSTCAWQFSTFGLPSGVTGLGVGYYGEGMQNYQSILADPFVDGASPSDPGSVITSLYLNQTAQAVGLAYVHSETASGFNGATYTVPAASLQAAAAQEGMLGHVVTAISYDGTQATYYSYGWTGDPSTVYETKVVFSTLATATGDIEALAQQGYILTASGSTQAADGSGVVLLGTRVQGDTMPRPVLVGSVLTGTVDPVMQQGYAIVAVVNEYQGNVLVIKNYIGER